MPLTVIDSSSGRQKHVLGERAIAAFGGSLSHRELVRRGYGPNLSGSACSRDSARAPLRRLRTQPYPGAEISPWRRCLKDEATIHQAPGTTLTSLTTAS